MSLFVWPAAFSGLATEATLLLIEDEIDGLETLVTATNTKLDTVIGNIDGVETALGTIGTNTGNTATDVGLIKGYVDQIESYVDQLEGYSNDIKTLITDRLSGSFVPAKYDYMSYASGASDDTYVFKSGGSGGTTVKTVVVTYTDSSKTVISNVAAT